MLTIVLQIPVAVDPQASKLAALQFFSDPVVMLLALILGALFLSIIAFVVVMGVLRRGKSLPKGFA
mgnify:CR=1 FL=1